MTRVTAHTAHAASMAVAAELSRRGYDVAFTLGNTPKVDLLCNVPNGDWFKVQVKGLSSANGFFIRASFFADAGDHNLFLVVVLVPPTPAEDDQPFRFFILSHAEAVAEYKKMPSATKDGREFEDGPGLNWGRVSPYEGHWSTFPLKVKSPIF